MSANANPLQERIARALYENAEYYGPAPTQPPWESRDGEERGEWMEIAAAVLPIIAAEVQAAKADAWDEGYLDRSPYGGRARSRADSPYRSTEQETRRDDQR